MTIDAVRNSRGEPRAEARVGAHRSAHDRRHARRIFTLPFFLLVVLVAAAAAAISYLLWPTWPNTPTALDAPAIPITVAGVLFNVPPARSAKRCSGIPDSRTASISSSNGRR